MSLYVLTQFVLSWLKYEIALAVSIGIGAYFAYQYVNRNIKNVSKHDYVYQATNY